MSDMRCEDAIEQIRRASSAAGDDLQAAMTHAAACDDCRSALRAFDALQILRDAPAPNPSDGALERALDKAIAHGPVQRYRRGYWSGLVSGAALAATLAVLAIGLWIGSGTGEMPTAVPEVRLALNQPRAVTVTLESPEALANAEVRVELRGAIALDGYAGQRELRWMTNLDRGINQLTLPVMAIDATGGQVLVEVTHGEKRRTFILDVRAGAAG
jgi:hypothetical protein